MKLHRRFRHRARFSFFNSFKRRLNRRVLLQRARLRSIQRSKSAKRLGHKPVFVKRRYRLFNNFGFYSLAGVFRHGLISSSVLLVFYFRLRSLFLVCGKSARASCFVGSMLVGLRFYLLLPLEVMLVGLSLASLPFYIQTFYSLGKAVGYPKYASPVKRAVLGLRVVVHRGLGRSRFLDSANFNFVDSGVRVACEFGDLFLGNFCGTERFLLEQYEEFHEMLAKFRI